jgi:hypothetical protein
MDLPYRDNVGALLFNRDGLIFVARRADLQCRQLVARDAHGVRGHLADMRMRVGGRGQGRGLPTGLPGHHGEGGQHDRRAQGADLCGKRYGKQSQGHGVSYPDSGPGGWRATRVGASLGRVGFTLP